MSHERGAFCRALNRSSVEPSVSEGGKLKREMADKFCLGPNFHVITRVLLCAAHLRHGTNGFTSLPKEGMPRIFTPEKIRWLRPGLNSRTRVPEASMLTTRPPKLLWTHTSRIPLISHCEEKNCCKSDQKCLLHFHSDIHIFLVLLLLYCMGEIRTKFHQLKSLFIDHS
jgi:hypothetical protein